jgi:hypothetical protein
MLVKFFVELSKDTYSPLGMLEVDNDTGLNETTINIYKVKAPVTHSKMRIGVEETCSCRSLDCQENFLSVYFHKP